MHLYYEIYVYAASMYLKNYTPSYVSEQVFHFLRSPT